MTNFDFVTNGNISQTHTLSNEGYLPNPHMRGIFSSYIKKSSI